MPNVLNERMLSEIESFLNEAGECVVVDFTRMTVDDAEDIRVRLRKEKIEMRVVKTSLARLAARRLGYEGADEVFNGPSAMIYGGESVAQVARVVRDIHKEKKTPVVRGGLLDKKALDPDGVQQLANLPSREELLAQVIGTIIAPVSGTIGAIEALMAAIPGLTQAWEEKLGGGGEPSAG